MLPNTNNSVKQFQEFNYTWNKRSLCDILKIKLTKLSSYIRIYHIAFLHFFFLIILVNLFFFWLDWNVLKKKKKKIKKERKKSQLQVQHHIPPRGSWLTCLGRLARLHKAKYTIFTYPILQDSERHCSYFSSPYKITFRLVYAYQSFDIF